MDGWINRERVLKREGVRGGRGVIGNERHYEEVSVKLGGKRRMEGQAKEVFKAWMSRQPYANATVCVRKLSVSLSFPVSQHY